MGRKKHSVGLGKSIIRDRFGKRTAPKGDNFLHTSELKDGYDWGRLNLQSVTEQSNLEDFLTTAELAGTEFTAEKLNVQFVDPQRTSGLLSSDEQSRIHKLHEEHKGLIRIPRRPSWNENTTPEELDRDERNSFLEWRRALSALQDIEGIVLTPYEKNLDFWRQLWRVIERSDVIVQVVDARNPLLFRCEDVEKYVNEVDSTKVNLVLINKADFLSDHQRQLWCDHFDQRNIRVAFWSALNETERQASNESGEGEEDVVHNESDPDTESDDEDDDDDDDDEDSETQEIGPDELCDNKTDDDESVDRRKDESVSMETEGARSKQNCDVQPDKLKQNVNTDFKEDRLSHNQEHPDMETAESAQNEINVSDSGDGCNCPTGGVELDPPTDTTAEICNKSQNTVSESDELNTVSSANVDMTDKNSEISSGATGGVQNDIKILDGPELLNLFRELHTGEKVQNGVTTIGMVGYPNVGKSSTINAILKMKKVPVSATPGRTKHFQTLYVDKDLMLCDCPGLVFPSFVSTKAELIVNGILPIDQMRDHVPPVSLVCHHIPKDVLETTYGVNIPPPPEEEDPDRHPTADEFLNAYGSMRGFMTARGLPDCPRSSRYILKDYVNGRLLYCNPPPDVDVQLFKPTVGMTETIKLKQHKSSGTKQAQPKPLSKVDREFFRKVDSGIHSKGPGGMSNFARTQGLQQVGSTSSSGSTPYSSMQSLSGKPWKKHNNRGKKEKLRRVFNEQDLI